MTQRRARGSPPSSSGSRQADGRLNCRTSSSDARLTHYVRRLRESFLAEEGATTLIAKTLLSSLDDAIVNEIVDTVIRERARDNLAGDMRKEERLEEMIREFEKAQNERAHPRTRRCCHRNTRSGDRKA